MATRLPAGFEDLEPFVARFAISGTANRAALRGDAPVAERDAFYAAIKDRIAPALDMLDAKPVDQLDAAEQRLLQLCLSFAHVALAIEVQGDDEPRHTAMRRHMRITRSPADELV